MAKSMPITRIGFIGSGHLAERIARKLVKKVTPQRKFCYKKQRLVSTLLASDPSQERRHVFDQLGFTTTEQNQEIIADCDVVFIGTSPRLALEGVFPHQLKESSTPVRNQLKSKLFVALMGDMPPEKVETLLYPGAKVIRMMPHNYLENIGLARGLLPPSSWATTRNTHASAEDIEKVVELAGISTCIEVDERSSAFWAFASGYSISSPAPTSASAAAAETSSSEDADYEMEEVGQDFHEQYVLGDYLGTGRFAQVYTATHRETGEVFAVKSVTDAELTQEGRDTLIAEVAALNRLNHPNVISHHGFFSENDNYFLLLDYCDRGSVRRLLRTKKRVCEATAKSIIRQLLQALEYCHVMGVVHRDVKAENVLLSRRGAEGDFHVQLADFGLSKELDLVSGYLQDMCGTPQYLSPEIVSGRTYAQPADIWSAGILSYMLLSGRVPFDNAGSEAELFRDIRIGAIWYHQADWKDVSPEAKDFVQKMLEVSPGARPSASELLAHKWFQD